MFRIHFKNNKDLTIIALYLCKTYSMVLVLMICDTFYKFICNSPSAVFWKDYWQTFTSLFVTHQLLCSEETYWQTFTHCHKNNELQQEMWLVQWGQRNLWQGQMRPTKTSVIVTSVIVTTFILETCSG